MSSDEEAIRALIALWMKATKARDTRTVLSLMTDDVVYLQPGKEPFGKEAFAGASAAMAGVEIDGTSEIVELQIAAEWAWTRNRLKLLFTPAGGAPITRHVQTLTILRKVAGHWKLARDASMPAAAPEAGMGGTG